MRARTCLRRLPAVTRPQTLARLRQRLDADYVISGSYLVAGSADNAPLRVDIALQDTRSGALRGIRFRSVGGRRA